MRKSLCKVTHCDSIQHILTFMNEARSVNWMKAIMKVRVLHERGPHNRLSLLGFLYVLCYLL